MYLAEMGKIWKMKTVLFIMIFAVLFFGSFMYQWIKPFIWDGESISSGDGLNEKLNIFSAWMDQYGNDIDEAEFREIENDYENILYHACSVIDENDYFREHGVNDYEDYLSYGQKAISARDGYDYIVKTDSFYIVVTVDSTIKI